MITHFAVGFTCFKVNDCITLSPPSLNELINCSGFLLTEFAVWWMTSSCAIDVLGADRFSASL